MALAHRSWIGTRRILHTESTTTSHDAAVGVRALQPQSASSERRAEKIYRSSVETRNSTNDIKSSLLVARQNSFITRSSFYQPIFLRYFVAVAKMLLRLDLNALLLIGISVVVFPQLALATTTFNLWAYGSDGTIGGVPVYYQDGQQSRECHLQSSESR